KSDQFFLEGLSIWKCALRNRCRRDPRLLGSLEGLDPGDIGDDQRYFCGMVFWLARIEQRLQIRSRARNEDADGQSFHSSITAVGSPSEFSIRPTTQAGTRLLLSVRNTAGTSGLDTT